MRGEGRSGARFGTGIRCSATPWRLWLRVERPTTAHHDARVQARRASAPGHNLPIADQTRPSASTLPSHRLQGERPGKHGAAHTAPCPEGMTRRCASAPSQRSHGDGPGQLERDLHAPALPHLHASQGRGPGLGPLQPVQCGGGGSGSGGRLGQAWGEQASLAATSLNQPRHLRCETSGASGWLQGHSSSRRQAQRGSRQYNGLCREHMAPHPRHLRRGDHWWRT